MNRKSLCVAVAALLAVGGLWWARSLRQSPELAPNKSDAVVSGKTQDIRPKPDQVLKSRGRIEPPDPTRRFKDFTPEQRVEFARKGQGPGG